MVYKLEKSKQSCLVLKKCMYCSLTLAGCGKVKEQATGTSIGKTGGKRESESVLSNKK